VVPDAGNPQAHNRFAYVLNNPVMLIDPTGHIACDNPNLPQNDQQACESSSSASSSAGTTIMRVDVNFLEMFGYNGFWEILVHVDPNDPELFDYEIAAYSLWQEHKDFHPEVPLYRQYTTWQNFFRKYGRLDAIGIVQTMFHRDRSHNYNYFREVILRNDDTQYGYPDNIGGINRNSSIYHDWLAIAYAIDRGLLPDLLNGRQFFNHRDTNSDVRNSLEVYPRQQLPDCCLDRAAFGYHSGRKDLVLDPYVVQRLLWRWSHAQ
ncbi:MAG: hypothetical protein H6650_08965, partial [Ardenticatenales bacterium]|nr:hypothetical protein [Ardenticatenales bacterium]